MKVTRKDQMYEVEVGTGTGRGDCGKGMNRQNGFYDKSQVESKDSSKRLLNLMYLIDQAT